MNTMREAMDGIEHPAHSSTCLYAKGQMTEPDRAVCGVCAAMPAARSTPVPASDVSERLREEWLLDIRDQVREAVIEGDAQDCSSSDCIADAVYEIVRVALRSLPAASLPASDVSERLREGDAEKLRTLATWFDHFDDWREKTGKIAPGIAEYREVQVDLRRIAAALAHAPTEGLDGAWAEAEAALNTKGGDWTVHIENHSGGDGYTEPQYDAVRAVAVLGTTFPEWRRLVSGSIEPDLAAALRALAARLRSTEAGEEGT